MTLFEGVTVLNLVICFYLVYTLAQLDYVIEDIMFRIDEILHSVISQDRDGREVSERTNNKKG